MSASVRVEATAIGRAWSVICPTCRRQHLHAELGEHEPACMPSALRARGLTRADVLPYVLVAARAAA